MRLRAKETPLWVYIIWVTIALLPMLLLRDFTPANELRYLSIADEALRNHNFFTFTNHGIIYADKPPLYFWIIMVGKVILGQHYMWFIALFSLLPALVTAVIMTRWAESVMQRNFASSGFLMLMTCGLFCGMTIFLRMDMLMTMFIVLALRSFFLQYTSVDISRKQHLLFPLWIFMAIFSKGPMGILIPLIATLVFSIIERKFDRWLRIWNWTTWLLLLSASLLWFTGVFIEGGKDYLDNLLFKQTVGRAVNSFHHDRPWWFYFSSIVYGWAPWTLLIVGAICYQLKNWKKIPTTLEKYFLVISLSTFILLSCISSKIDVYLLPAYPFFVFSTIILLSRTRYNSISAAGLLLPVVALIIALVGALIYSAIVTIQKIKGVEAIAYTAATVMLAGLIITILATLRWRDIATGIRSFSLTLLTTVYVVSFALPRYNSELGYAALCRKAKEICNQKDVQCYAWKMSRPENVDVYLHKEIKKVETSADSVQMWQEARNKGIVVISRQDRQPQPLSANSVVYKVGDKFCVTFIPSSAPSDK